LSRAPSAVGAAALRRIDDLAARLAALSRDIHAHPETAFAEHGTVRRITAFLRAFPEVDVEEGLAGLPTAFRASTGGPGPAIGVVCEYDAVPGQGHSCGHNLIAASGAAVVAAVAAVTDRLPGRVVLVGSPAEEGAGGKLVLAERGAYDGLSVILQTHPADRNRLSGPTIGKADLDITFLGRASHVGSANDRGVNALDAVLQTFASVNAMRQHLRDGTRVYGIVTHGGDMRNTIPGRASAEFGVRSPDEAYLREVVARVRRCAEAAAIATGCTVEVAEPPRSYYPPMKLNRALAALLGEALRGLGEPVEDVPPGHEGYANDIGAVSRRVPAALLNYAIGPRGLAEHSDAFLAAAASADGERGMLRAAKAVTIAAVTLLEDSAALARVRAEFEA
jgi:amidohydrolase